jgi:hypothetical protein
LKPRRFQGGAYHLARSPTLEVGAVSRTYKDIRPEYREQRRQQIAELARVRAVRMGVRERERDRRELALEQALPLDLALSEFVVAWVAA